MVNFRPFIAVALLCSVGACSDDAKPTAPPAANSAAAHVADNAPAEAQSASSHYYAIEDHGEYGYQPVVSQNDENAGMSTAPLTMIRYLGQKDGVYALYVPADGGAYTLLTCKDPCEYMKASVFWNGRVVKHMTVPPGHSVAAAAFKDAISGQLQPYRRH